MGEHPRSLATLAGLGFQAALSLQEEEEDGPRDDSPPDFSFVRVPVRDGLVGGAPTLAQLKEASDAIGRFLDAGLPTYVFCYAGVGRSPLACMAYLGRTGRLSLGEAYRKVAGAHSRTEPTSDQLLALARFLGEESLPGDGARAPGGEGG